MEPPAAETSPRRAGGMKRQREQRVTWSDRDADGDRLMDSDADDASMCGGSARRLSDDDGDVGEQPVRKRAMLIKTNLRILEKLPPLRNYQRSLNGRRGAIDGGTLTGAMMMAALEESFEETSFVTLEPPAREAMVAPTPMPLPSASPFYGRSREVSPAQQPPRIRPATARTAVSAKDDEARPASE